MLNQFRLYNIYFAKFFISYHCYNFFLLKKIIFILLVTGLMTPAFSQHTQFSIATDLGLQRSIKKEQRYWAIGQSVQAHFHITPKDGAYIWISYYSAGKFDNKLSAKAKSILTNPQQVNYTNHASMRFKQISMGWKHYLKGSAVMENTWGLYCYAGFGLLPGSVTNNHSLTIDTSQYTLPVLSGKANFKRLTLDLGLGWEIPIGGSVYIYNEGRVWIPTTDYPSDHIFINRQAPLVALFNLGLRILFD